MPNYSFNCKSCDHSFEQYLKMNDRKIPLDEPCPQCQEVGSVVQSITGFMLGDPVVLGKERLPQKFKEGVLDKVKKMPGAAQKESKFN
jgi:putative FmdB family regulatory protein